MSDEDYARGWQDGRAGTAPRRWPQGWATWRPGDPCRRCGSTDTGIDFDDIPFCGTCRASDADE